MPSPRNGKRSKPKGAGTQILSTLVLLKTSDLLSAALSLREVAVEEGGALWKTRNTVTGWDKEQQMVNMKLFRSLFVIPIFRKNLETSTLVPLSSTPASRPGDSPMDRNYTDL